MCAALTVLVLAGPAAADVSAATIDPKFLGTWGSVGPVNQPSSSKTYYLAVTLRDGARGTVVGEVYYPGLECGGTWTLLEASPNRLVLREDITINRAACVVTGMVTLVPGAGGRLNWSWSGEDGPATAQLARQAPPPPPPPPHP